MRAKWRFLILAALGASVGLFAQSVYAIGPAPLAPRGAFTTMIVLNSGMAGDCGPLGIMPLGTGIDATSPFFMFDIDSGGTRVTYTYRPRADDCGSCNVRYFGDGGIDAVEDFRTLYERWKRSTHPVVFAPYPACANVVSMGGSNSCQGPCLTPVTFTPRDFMTSARGVGTGGADLYLVVDPTTNTFEDYKFEYSVFN